MRKDSLPEYQVWKDMRRRCFQTNSKVFERYGGRGIEISHDWDCFYTFLSDIGRRPSGDYSLERIDNNKGYSKDNCRWASRIEQQNNRRNTLVVEYLGIKKPLREWCRDFGIDRFCTIEKRIKKYGWSIERAFQTPIKKWRRHAVPKM